jgi:hypothetical protein
MSEITSSFEKKFFMYLEKSSCLTKRDHEALWEIISALIGASSFSLSSLSTRLGRRIGRNYLARLLKKYSFIQRKVMKELLKDVLTSIGKYKKLYLIIDDTLVEKSGQKIFASLRWYNHSSNRQTRALCLVNLVLEVDGKVLLFIPWLLTSTTMPTKKLSKKLKQQDLKNDAAITMIQSFINVIDLQGISRQHIIIEADSWYSPHEFRSSLQKLSLDYRIDGKSNYSVQKVDHDAMKKAKEQTRGRKRTRFVKYEKIAKFMGDYKQWSFFTHPTSGERIFYKKAFVTLKAGGQSIIYGYMNEKYKNPKFIMVNPKRKHMPDPRTIYRDYTFRWIIEVCHREIKQQFNIGKCQSRGMWIVNGFLMLLGFTFSVWKISVYFESQEGGNILGCPTWANNFHEEYIKSH